VIPDFTQKVFSQLFNPNPSQKVNLYIEILDLFRVHVNPQTLSKDIQKYVVSDVDPSLRSLSSIINLLFKKQLLSLPDYQELFISMLTKLPSLQAITCVSKALRQLVFEEGLIYPQNVVETISAL